MPCLTCGGERWMCEGHPDQPMGHGGCTGAGDPCTDCQLRDRPLMPPGYVSYISAAEGDEQSVVLTTVGGATPAPHTIRRARTARRMRRN